MKKNKFQHGNESVAAWNYRRKKALNGNARRMLRLALWGLYCLISFIYENRKVLLKVLKIAVGGAFAVVAIFAGGMMEHPGTPLLSRLSTAVLQGAMLVAVILLVKETAADWFCDIGELLDEEDDEEWDGQ